MSLKVMNWVWEHSKTKGTELLLLLAIADAASDDGSNAFPSKGTLARKTRLDTRTVRRIVDRLVSGGHITVRQRGGRESNRYTVLMQEEFSTRGAECHGGPNATGGETPPQGWHGDPPRGGTQTPPGVTQLCPPTPPITVLDPSSSGGGGGGTNPEEVLNRLGPSWPLGPKQRRRLTPKIERALSAGWTPERLASHLAANPEGVKAPGAVLAARLDDLPDPPQPRGEPFQSRPVWCGTCHESTRLVEDDTGRPSRCPRCHPLAVADAASLAVLAHE